MRNEKIDYAARFLIRSCQKAFLATELSKKSLDKKTFTSKNSIPYSTFVMTASDYDGSPLILLSNLSEHTKNLKTNNLASLLFYEEQKDGEEFIIKFFLENSEIIEANIKVLNSNLRNSRDGI